MTATGTATATTQPTATTKPFSGIYLPLVLDAGQGLPNPTVTPLATATPTPTPTASPAPGGIPVLSSSTYTTGTGSRYIVGEVRNDNAHNVEFVKITARFLDAAGNLLGSEFAYTRLDILTPGQRSPFAVTSLNPPDRYHHYALEVEASATQRQPLAGLTIVNPDDQPVGPSGSRSISGQVRNDSGGAVEALQIVATVYDQSGTVVATDVVNAQRPQLAAGATSQFTIIVLHWDGGVRYELQAQARRP